jgi:hypothetical protein
MNTQTSSPTKTAAGSWLSKALGLAWLIFLTLWSTTAGAITTTAVYNEPVTNALNLTNYILVTTLQGTSNVVRIIQLKDFLAASTNTSGAVYQLVTNLDTTVSNALWNTIVSATNNLPPSEPLPSALDLTAYEWNPNAVATCCELSGQQYAYSACMCLFSNQFYLLYTADFSGGLYANNQTAIAIKSGSDPNNLGPATVLAGPTASTWHSAWISGPNIYQEGGTNYVYAFGGTTGGTETPPMTIGAFTSTDMVNWTDQGSLLSQGATTNDNGALYRPTVIKNIKTGIYYLYYNASSATGPNTERFCMATATGPLGPWTKYPNVVYQPNTNGVPTTNQAWRAQGMGDMAIFPGLIGTSNGWVGSYSAQMQNGQGWSGIGLFGTLDLTNFFDITTQGSVLGTGSNQTTLGVRRVQYLNANGRRIAVADGYQNNVFIGVAKSLAESPYSAPATNFVNNLKISSGGSGIFADVPNNHIPINSPFNFNNVNIQFSGIGQSLYGQGYLVVEAGNNSPLYLNVDQGSAILFGQGRRSGTDATGDLWTSWGNIIVTNASASQVLLTNGTGTFSGNLTVSGQLITRKSNGSSPTAITVTASPFTWTNTTGGSVFVFVGCSGAVTISINGSSIGTGASLTPSSYPLQTNETFTLGYTGTPNMSWKPY